MFFVKYNDPIYVKLEKLDIMIRLASQANIAQVRLPQTPCYCISTSVFNGEQIIRIVPILHIHISYLCVLISLYFLYLYKAICPLQHSHKTQKALV